MKKSILLPSFILGFILITLQSCSTKISGSGNIVSKSIPVGEFDGISSSGSIDVHLTKGMEGTVTVSTDDNLQEYISVENIDNILIIKAKDGVNFKAKKGVHVYVPFESISEVTLYGSGEIETEDEINTENFTVKLLGSGDIELKVDASNTEINLEGSGDIELEGETNDLVVNVTGSGDFKGYGLKSNNANVNVSGSGDAKVYVKNNLTAKVEGSGDIKYKGNPDEKDIKTSGSGDIKDASFF